MRSKANLMNTSRRGAVLPLLAILSAACMLGCSSDSNERLYRAAATNDVASLQKLLKRGADPNKLWRGPPLSGQGGHRPLHAAAGRGNIECLTLLLDHGADANLRDDVQGFTPLMHAAASRQLQAMEILIRGGANPHATTPDGVTVLSVAIEHRFSDAVRLLSRSGVDTNQPQEGGWYPLMMACCDERVEFNKSMDDEDVATVQALLECGANPQQVIHLDETVLERIERVCPYAGKAVGIMTRAGH